MDKPQVDRIEGIPPAIAIDQSNPSPHLALHRRHHDGAERPPEAAVRARRPSPLPTVRPASCGVMSRPPSPKAHGKTATAAGDPGSVITFPVAIPENFSEAEVLEAPRSRAIRASTIARRRPPAMSSRIAMHPSLDRRAASPRVIEALEAALRVGHGPGDVDIWAEDGLTEAGPLRWRFSTDLHCATCDIRYERRRPASSRSTRRWVRAKACRGFGRIIGIDFGLVVPDESKTLAAGRDQAVADTELQGMPGRSAEVRAEARRRHGHPVA
jgi:excinuclease ABC subunit A